MTGIVQGSAATIGVVQKIYEAGGMTFMAVLPFVFGSNIGTTVTGILAALGGSLSAKRTAGLHTLFNVIGTIIAMVLLHPFANFIIYLSNTLNIPLMMQIAVAHIIFNVTTTLILLPFLGTLCKIIRKIIPGNEPEKIEINVLGTMYFTRALIANMIQNRYGRVVNVSSVAGVYGIRNMVDYSTTKGAINAFTLALAKEVTEFGVTVNSVSPGNILSDSNLEKDNPELSFAGRSGTNKECADVICFLASEKASYVSGQNYIVDGCRKKM